MTKRKPKDQLISRIKDITGQRFGKLTVLKLSETRLHDKPCWDCLCDCGNSKIANGCVLRMGKLTSCGCNQYQGNPVDITGQKFNRLTAISHSGNKNKHNGLLWNFVCDCGNTIEQEAYPVTSGTTKSCGCYAKEVAGKASVTHGFSGSLEYAVWDKLKARILDPNNKNYHRYGGRGLNIEPEWITDMEAFYQHLGPKPDEENRYTVGRIDNNLGYVKGNIRWETYSKQAHNRSKMISNSSNFTGVVWACSNVKTSATYAVARWHEGKKQCTKSFKVSELGLLPAFKAACEYRIKMIEVLNTRGEEYAPDHGK